MLNRSNAKAAPFRAIENLESRRLMTSTYDIGINMNDGASATVPVVVPILKNLGVKTLRLWTSVYDFNTRSMNGVLKRAVDYSNAGFDITLIVQTGDGKMQSTSAVSGWFNWAMSQPSLKAAVDHWEIGNEPDHYQYWQGNLGQYVNNFLKPAYEALNAHGEEVISAGPSWNAQDVQTMINAGMLNYCDYVGFHPYAKGVSGVVKSINAINEVVAGRKPIAATEWNVRGFEGDKASWAQAVQDVFPHIKQGFALNYYFAMKVQNSMAGPGGILTSSLTPNQPFYNAFATFSGAPAVNPTTGTGTTPQTNYGKITGTLWEDTDADGIKDSGEAATGSRVVYIDANANGNLDAGEKQAVSDANGIYAFSSLSAGTYKVTRVFPSGYKLSNNAAGYVAAAVTAGKTTTGINLGSTKATVTPPPVTSTKGAISGSLWEDTDGDGKWDTNEVATGSRTVFLDANGNGLFDTGEKSTLSNSKGVYTFTGLNAGNYKVDRVFPAGYKLSNNTAGYVPATVYAGKTTSGVNLGSTKTTTVVPPTPPTTVTTPAIKLIRLIDTTTNKVIAAYSNITKSLTISIASLKTKNIAVEAVGNGYVKSMKLSALGKTITESSAPFAFFTDSHGAFSAWAVQKGSYTFSATGYSGVGATGTKGNTLSVTLTFVA